MTKFLHIKVGFSGMNGGYTYYVSFLIEDSVHHTLWGHPLEGQLHVVIFPLPEVASGVHIFREAKVSNLDIPIRVKPAKQWLTLSYHSTKLSWIDLERAQLSFTLYSSFT
jgi:hypothetical protein